MEVPLILFGAVMIAGGLVGCILPVIPGPPLSFVGLLMMWGARGWHAETFGGIAVAVLGALTVIVTVLDFLMPVWGAKRYGASKAGLWGSVIGMIVGMVVFPPFGMLIGAFGGALAAELGAGQGTTGSTKAAWGVFVGTMMGIGLKLAVSFACAVLFVWELLSLMP